MIRRLSLAAALLAGVLVAGTAAAQQFPPHRFFGTLTVNGQPAAAGTVLQAFQGTAECGSATLSAPGQYVIDVAGPTQSGDCRGGAITFTVSGRNAAETSTFRQGGFEQLNLTVGGGAPPPAARFNGASLDLSSPCVPDAGELVCSAERQALWTADRDAWGRRGVVDEPPFIPFEGRVFTAVVVLRVEAGDPGVIRNIARILGNPFLQVTQIRFRGAEYVEITNLGSGPQEMEGWSLRSPNTNQIYRFSAFTMEGGQICRVYSGAVGENACPGNATFNVSDVWPDEAGRVILNFDALDLLGDDVEYNADPARQPPPPNLQGVDLP